MIDRLVLDAGKSLSKISSEILEFTFDPKYSLDLIDLKPNVVRQFLMQNECNIEDLTADLETKKKIRNICIKTIELRKDYPVNLCLSYGKILDTPLLLQKCIITQNNGQFFIKLNYEIALRRNFARIMNISEKHRIHRTNNIFRASNAIAGFNNSLRQHGRLYNIKQYSKHYSNMKIHNFESDCGIIEFDDCRILSIFLDEEIITENVLIKDCAEKNYLKSPIIRALDRNSALGREFLQNNYFKLESYMNSNMFSQFPDAMPDDEFGIGDLSAFDRSILGEYNSKKSFIIENCNNNSDLTASFIAQSACKGEKVVHITQKDETNSLIRTLNTHGLGNLHIDLTQNVEFFKKTYEKINRDWSDPKLATKMVDFESENQLSQIKKTLTNIFDSYEKIIDPWQISINEIALNCLKNIHLNHVKFRLNRNTCLKLTGKFDIYCNEILNYVLSCKNFNSTLNNLLKPFENKLPKKILDDVLALWNKFKYIDSRSGITDCNIFGTLQLQNFTTLWQNVNDICENLSIIRPMTFSQWFEYDSIFRKIIRIQDIFLRDIFEIDLDPFINALASKSEIDVIGEKVGFFEKNRLLKELQSFIRPGFEQAFDSKELYKLLISIKDTKAQWQKIHLNKSNNNLIAQKFNISLPNNIAKVLSMCELVQIDINHLSEFFDHDFTDYEFDDLFKTLELLKNTCQIQPLTNERHSISHTLQGIGVLDFAKYFQNNIMEKSDSEEKLNIGIRQTLEFVWHQSVFDFITSENQALMIEIGSVNNLIERFIELDTLHINSLDIPIKYSVDNYRKSINQMLNTQKQDALQTKKVPDLVDNKPNNEQGIITDFVSINNKNLIRLIRKFYFSFTVSNCDIGTIHKLGFGRERHIDTLIISDLQGHKFWEVLPLIAISKQVIIFNKKANVDENVQKYDYLIEDVMGKILPTINYNNQFQINKNEASDFYIQIAKKAIESEGLHTKIVSNTKLIVSHSEIDDGYTSKPCVGVSFDFIDYTVNKSIRSVFRHGCKEFSELNNLHLSIINIIKNSRLEITKIKNALNLTNTAIMKKISQKKPQIDQRGLELLENVPPHWQ